MQARIARVSPNSLLPVVPSFLVALFVYYCGTFGRAGFLPAVVGAMALALVSLVGLSRWRSPLGDDLPLRVLRELYLSTIAITASPA